MDTTPQFKALLEAAQVRPDLTENLERQEVGDAEFFSSMFSGKAVFDHSERLWFLWSGHHWTPDITGRVFSLVTNQLAAEYLAAATEAQQRGNGKLSDRFIRRRNDLLNVHRIKNVLELASKLPDIGIQGTEWDVRPMELPVSNGILDLTNAAFRATLPSDYVRSFAPVEWLGLDCPAPQWERALLEIFQEDSELIDYFRRICGYSISGNPREQILPILWGQGGNGKSTIMDALSAVLGRDLCFTTQSDSLMELGRGDGNAARPFIAALRNKRLVLASESGEGRHLNAGMVKQLTGDHFITARGLYANPVTFKVTYTIMLITNHCPRLPDSTDYAIWRRVQRIPFEVQFVDKPESANQRSRDRHLSEGLLAESSGILAWLVRGCLEWQQEGLNPPTSVQASTARYREEEDLVAQYISDRLIANLDADVSAGDLYRDYTDWCSELGLKPFSSQAFGQRIAARFGAAQVLWKDRRSQRVYRGVGLLTKRESAA